MKYHLSKIVFLTVVLFLVGGYFVYTEVLVKKVNNVSFKTIEIKDISHTNRYLLKLDKRLNNSSQIELSILGNSNEIISLIIEDENHQFSKQIRLKNGIIDRDFILPCNQSEVFLRIEAPQNALGNLTIGYRFIVF